MNIVVLAGGLSPERDVSLSSGAMIAGALRGLGHHAILLDLFFGVDDLPHPVTRAFESVGALPPYCVPETAPDLDAIRLRRKSGYSADIGNGVLELCRAADITYLALHGDCGENGTLQAFFDLSGIRYTGSSSIGCTLAMDKHITKQLLRDANVLTPEGVLYHRSDEIGLDSIELPCVVKPCCGGSSIGISIAHDRAALGEALTEAFRYENEVLIEECITGMELSAGILGEEALPLIEIVPKHSFYDYQHKYQVGWTDEIVPARLDEKTTKYVQEMALRAFRALRLSVYARIDFLLTKDGKAYCLEGNTLPGMTPTSLLPQEAAAVGIAYPDLCDRIISLSLEKYR